jgi:hypothetical protein
MALSAHPRLLDANHQYSNSIQLERHAITQAYEQ